MSPLDHALGLLEKARHDLVSGKATLGTGDAFDMVCFHGQQAVEKSLKALLAMEFGEHPEIHSLGELVDLAAWASFLLLQVSGLDFLLGDVGQWPVFKTRAAAMDDLLPLLPRDAEGMRRLASTLERRAWAEGLAGTEGLADIFLGWIRGLVRREEDFQAQIRDLVPALDGAIPGMRRVGELRGRVLALSYFAVKVRYEGDPDEATAREALDTARAVYDLAAKLIHEREG